MIRRLLPALAIMCAASGCGQTGDIPVMTCPTLPTKRVSTQPDPLPPISAQHLALQPAHWDWRDGGYVWEQPQWTQAPDAHPVWQDGFWAPNGGGCAWTPGHFVP